MNTRDRRPSTAKSSRIRASRNKKRILTLQVGLLTLLALVAWRIDYLQQVFGPGLLSQAAKNDDVSRVLLAPRGAILDSQGNRLAYDIPAYYMDVDLAPFQTDPSQLAKLANIVGMAVNVDPSKVLSTFEKNHNWIQWPYPVLEPVKEQVTKAMQAFKGGQQDVTFTPTEERFYPYGSFAANMLGYVGPDGAGDAGLEAEYNAVLAGHNGKLSYTQDALGFPIPSSVKVVQPAQPGDSIELTIDPTIQGFVEHEMDDLVSKYNPEHAAIIVANPQTGAILAMSSRPTFNPNQYWTADPTALNDNWAVNSSFEPGSTFKIIVLAAALATNTISLNQTFMSGHMVVDGKQINDWNWIGWGRITFQQALEMSSNVGFATIALRLGWANLLHYMSSFGFLNKTGIDLPAESTSIIFPPSLRGNLQLATSGFGQGIAVTPMQQIAAVGAIANGGKLMKPYLAKAIVSPSGKVIKSFSPTVVRANLLPPGVDAEVNNTMELDVSQGIDTSGIIPGYDVAGKTGTAQVVDPKTGQYYNNRFIVSFIGYAPGWDPQIEVYVTVYWPKTPEANTWGSTIATPIARDILKDCLQYYHIPPQGAATSLAAANGVDAADQTKYVETPNLVGMNVDAARGLAGESVCRLM